MTSPANNRDRIEAAKAAADIVQIARRYTELEQSGQEYVGRCPMPGHEDRTPSFFVNPEKEVWICRGACGRGGDVLNLVQEVEGKSLGEVVDDIYGRNDLAVSTLEKGLREGREQKAEPKPKKPKVVSKEEVVRWLIKDADGKSQALHIRYRTIDEEGNEGKSYSYRNPDGSFEKGKIKTHELPLYRAEFIKNWPDDVHVILVEGEKAADALADVGCKYVVGTACGASSCPSAEVLEVLRDFDITIWRDADKPGVEHAQKLADELEDIVSTTRVFASGEEESKDDAADHPAVTSGDKVALAELVEDLKQAPLAKDALPKASNVRQLKAVNGSKLPAIQVSNRQMRDVTADALDALVAANNPPHIFERGGGPARVGKDERGEPTIQPLTADEIRHHMNCSADFYRFTAQGNPRQVNPPIDIAKDILASPSRPLPPLTGIVETPYLRPDGTIHDQPGYDPTTRYYYAPAAGFTMPSVPDTPTSDDVTKALEILIEAVGEFPYDSEASAANALALLLTPVIRQAINGPAPLLLIEKPQAGTGGSLLAEVAAAVGTGRAAEMMGAPKHEEEWRKQITAKLIAGSAVITLDNIDGPLEAPSLSRALTARTWVDRELGVSKIIRVPQNATWIGTGNNIVLRGDLPRRCVSIRLDAKTSRPWQRKGFRHPDLMAWVERSRGELVRSLLILARAWWAAGRPAAPDLVKLGSFESWAETVGGILAHAGVEGFLGNSERVYQKAAQEDNEWESFFAAWHEASGESAITVGQLTDEIEKDDEFREAVPPFLQEALDKSRGSFSRKLGNALSRNEGKRFGERNYYVERAGMEHKVITWRLKTGESENTKGGYGGFWGFCEPVTSEIAGRESDFHHGVAEINPPNPPNPPTSEKTEAPASSDDFMDKETPEDDQTSGAEIMTRIQELLDEEE